MKITVAGLGNSGSAIAGDLALKGHEVTMLKTSELPLNGHQQALFDTHQIQVVEDGISRDAPLARVTDDYAAALPQADLVIVCTQTSRHESVIRTMAPHLRTGQTVLFEPGYLSSAYMLKYVQTPGIAAVEAASTPINSRITGPGVVRIAFRNSTSQVGVWPPEARDSTMKLLRDTGYEWRAYDSVVEAALHNPNLIVHTVGGLMSIPRIEATDGDYWMYKEVFTPHVWNIVEALDSEKMSLLNALGLTQTPYVESCQERNADGSESEPLETFFEWAQNHSQRGPSVPDSRYLTEDVPQGLAMLESLGQALGIPTPVASSLITLSGSALRRDFRSSSARTTGTLGKRNLEAIIGRDL